MSGFGSSPWAVAPAAPAAAMAVSGNSGLGPRRWLVEHGPWLLSALGALAYLILKPPSGDLAAQLYRADLFARHGFVLWDGQWYGGHHMLDYSVLLPPLGALVGVRLVGALTAVASAALFAGIVRRQFAADPARASGREAVTIPARDRADRGWGGLSGADVAALWFGVGAAVTLMSNRIAYDLGVVLGLAAIALVQRRRRWGSLALATLASLASPVAGAFLVLAAGAWVAGSTHVRRRDGRRGLTVDHRVVVDALFLAAGGALPVAALVLPFPEGGQEPFAPTSFWPALAAIAMVALILPRQQRVLRVGTVLYGLACAAAFAFPDPLGGNAVRLGTLFAGPLVAGALWPHRLRVLAAAAVPLVYWQCVAPVRDVLQHIGDPAVRSGYFRPLVSFLASRHDGPFRVEIPFTLSHWEAYSVARVTPIARGWERQIDILNNGLFYRPGLTSSSYRAWLQRMGVRYVALPDAPLDDSGRAEAALIREGLPYLTPVWSSEHWRVYRVQGAVPLAAGPGRLRELSVDSVVLHARRPGDFVVRENFTPYWTVTQGYGCVAPGPGGLTQVSALAPGKLVLGVRFSLARIGASTPRCSPPPPASTTARR